MTLSGHLILAAVPRALLWCRRACTVVSRRDGSRIPGCLSERSSHTLLLKRVMRCAITQDTLLQIGFALPRGGCVDKVLLKVSVRHGFIHTCNLLSNFAMMTLCPRQSLQTSLRCMRAYFDRVLSLCRCNIRDFHQSHHTDDRLPMICSLMTTDSNAYLAG